MARDKIFLNRGSILELYQIFRHRKQNFCLDVRTVSAVAAHSQIQNSEIHRSLVQAPAVAEVELQFSEFPCFVVYLYPSLWARTCQFEDYYNLCAYFMYMYISMQRVSY